jgi:hypothetical protein
MNTDAKIMIVAVSKPMWIVKAFGILIVESSACCDQRKEENTNRVILIQVIP